jgi:transcription elongation GreA/GreB family factor
VKSIKKNIYQVFLSHLKDKVAQLNITLAELKQMGAGETKSTAGDKHETALAMLQIEEAKYRNQLQLALNDLAVLQKIDPEIISTKVALGSFVITDKGCYYLCVALGKLQMQDKVIIAISPKSPLGLALLGKQIGDACEVASIKHTLLFVD